MRLFDTHCHLTDERFLPDQAAVIERMKAAGVELGLVIGDASEDPESVLALCEQYEFLYAALGVHPHNAACWDEALASKTDRLLSHPRVRALGEIGLDYHYDLSPRDVQTRVFDAQLDMAWARDLPAILHIREAHGDATALLTKRFRENRLPRCVLHCYSGSWESAKQYLAMGLYISFTGSVTFANAPKLREVAEKMPIDRLMVETDCPYMAPVPLRGKRNEPAFVAHTAEKIAELRAVPGEALAERALENGKRFFGISD